MNRYIARDYKKKIITCPGTACGDRNAQCNRSHLIGSGGGDKHFNFELGGCNAINERATKRGAKPKKRHVVYKKVWDFINKNLPKAEDENAVIVPRSFVASDLATFFKSSLYSLGYYSGS